MLGLNPLRELVNDGGSLGYGGGDLVQRWLSKRLGLKRLWQHAPLTSSLFLIDVDYTLQLNSD